MDMHTDKKPLDYLKVVFRRKWLIIIPIIIGISGGIIAANTLPKKYRSSTLVLVEEGRVINPLIEGLAVSTSVAQRLAVLREQILGWDRINQLITKLNLAEDIKTQQDFEDLVARLRRNIIVKLRGRNMVSIFYEGGDPRKAMNIVKTITDIFIAENLRQQNMETENAIAFINDQLGLYKKKLKQGDIAGMKEKLDNLLIDSTEKHPMVIDLRKKIEASQKELDAGNYDIEISSIAETDSELAGLRGELKSLRENVAGTSSGPESSGANRTRLSTTTDDKLYKFLLLETLDKVAQRDVGVNQALYNELLKRLETAKITQRLEASRDGTRYTILDPARLPLKPAKPNKLLVLFMGAFFGICAGLGLVFVTEIFDHSFLGVNDAKAYLDLPVLGAVAKIVTQSDIRVQKIRNIKITLASAITSAVLLVVIIFNILLGS